MISAILGTNTGRAILLYVAEASDADCLWRDAHHFMSPPMRAGGRISRQRLHVSMLAADEYDG